jgi:regulator of cell morphogenesis and NO signaling
MSTAYLDKTIGQLVAEQPARSRVFERWGLDYCCGGKRTLEEACAKKSLDAEAVRKDLQAVDHLTPAPTVDLTQVSLSDLCDHVVSAHHDFLREALPRLSYLTGRVAERHGDRDPRLVQLRDVFSNMREELEEHTAKEERVLFPAIKALEAKTSHFGLEAPIRQMMLEHDDAGRALETMSELTNGYQPDEQACNTHRAMLQALAELEGDLHQHVHKENNILFPRARALETAV